MDDRYSIQGFFERKVEHDIFINSFLEYPTNKNYLYYFHGESGIGKTTLFDYLCKLIKYKNESEHCFLPIIVTKNFTQKYGIRDLYEKIKNSDERIYFSFPKYEIACRFLYKRLNENEYKIESSSETVDNIVDEIRNVIEFEKPVETTIISLILGCFYKVSKIVVQSEYWKQQENKLSTFIQELQRLNFNDIENKLFDYFLDDINQSLEITSQSKQDYHLIFAVDAFEKRPKGENQDWLCEFISKINKSIWYIFGIENNIKASLDLDKISFDQNLVKRFTLDYKLHQYLQQQGVEDIEDRKYILTVSKGLPASIRILIDIYKKNGKAFNNKSEYTNYKELFKFYYSKHLSEEEKQGINILSVFETWDYSVFQYAAKSNYIMHPEDVYNSLINNAAFVKINPEQEKTFVLIDIARKTIFSQLSETDIVIANKVKYCYYTEKADKLIEKIRTITSDKISDQQYFELNLFTSEAVNAGTQSYLTSEEFYNISNWCTKTQQFMSEKGLFILKSKLIELYIQNIKEKDNFKYDVDDTQHNFYFQNIGDQIWAYRKSANRQAEMNKACEYYTEMIKRHGIKFFMLPRAMYYMGLACSNLCDYDTAKYFFEQCLEVCNTKTEDPNATHGLVIVVTNTLGCLNMDLGYLNTNFDCFEDAEELLQRALSWRNANDKRGLKTSHINLSRLYFRWATAYRQSFDAKKYSLYLSSAEYHLQQANIFQSQINTAESYAERYSIEAQKIVLDITKATDNFPTQDKAIWRNFQSRIQKIIDNLQSLTNENTEQFVLSLKNNMAVLEVYLGDYPRAGELFEKCLFRKKLFYNDQLIKNSQNKYLKTRPSIALTEENLKLITQHINDSDRVFHAEDFILQY